MKLCLRPAADQQAPYGVTSVIRGTDDGLIPLKPDSNLEYILIVGTYHRFARVGGVPCSVVYFQYVFVGLRIL